LGTAAIIQPVRAFNAHLDHGGALGFPDMKTPAAR